MMADIKYTWIDTLIMLAPCVVFLAAVAAWAAA
jgi:hypothetical protein